MQALSLNKSNQPAWLGFCCALATKLQPRLAFHRLMVAPRAWGGSGGLAPSTAQAGTLPGHWGGTGELQDHGDTTGEDNVPSPEPKLCPVWCQYAQKRRLLLRAGLCLREQHPQKQIRSRSPGDPSRSRSGRSLETKARLDGALRSFVWWKVPLAMAGDWERDAL